MLQRFLVLFFLVSNALTAQNYFYEKYQPFNPALPSPAAFLGYDIGTHHTRHDLIVAYLTKLAEVSDRATLTEYGRTHEGRKLLIFTVSTPKNLANLESLKQSHLAFVDPTQTVSNYDDVPVFVNLGYNIHGNEPSCGEAALLTAYTLVASDHPEIKKYLENAVVMIDPTLNPDGRDRFTHWANMYKGSPLVADPQDAEHQEYWPRGRTNHYWFDLNRDWLLGIHPESRGKLKWYHEWYPNVVSDFHEMGTNSSYFFEPMKDNGSLDPIMPKENYIDLNNLFGNYFAKAMDSVGSFYFTKEVFDGTYPGYGSSYPDLQGGLGLLFEQASSRGHVQETAFGKLTFPFTIRNQYISSIAALEAAVANKAYLRKYQQDFFKSALTNAAKTRIKGYTFKEDYDQNRMKAFIDKLLLHKVAVYRTNEGYTVPTRQPQYRMVQTFFETYDKYRDSVYYDASAWSVANFYNIKYKSVSTLNLGEKVTTTEGMATPKPVIASNYAYIIDYDDYNAPAVLYYLQDHNIKVSTAFKPFEIQTESGKQAFNYGALVVPVPLQKTGSQKVFEVIQKAQQLYQVPIYAVKTGYSTRGIDLGSRNIRPLTKPKAAMLIGDGVSSYEAGEVWHLLDARVQMPITKIPLRNLERVNLDRYNVFVLVSGRYQLSDKQQRRLQDWVKKGNTLVTIGRASEWLLKQELVEEQLIEKEKDTSNVERKPYVDARENIGKDRVGGIILKVDLDITHPLAFGYHDTQIPIYKNNTVWLKPSKNAYATVAKYAKKAHVDGFITKENTETFLKHAASLVVSPLGSGRVVLFADNPNFRGSWYGTNRLFLNALFLGNHVNVPE